MTASPADIREYEARKAQEREKALRKYGPDALLPAGHPEWDLLDFAINELVGLVRYGEMLEARHEEMAAYLEEVPKGTVALCKDGVALSRELATLSSRYAFDLIALRRKLKGKGLALGLTEAAA